MNRITKRFTFEAAHRLLDHPKCGRLHGHSYTVTLVLETDHLRDGMVRDYADLSRAKQFIDETLDHRYLVSQELVDAVDMYWRVNPDECAMIDVSRTTAECLAKWLFEVFFDMFPELVAVTVKETAATSATYWKEGDEA